MPAAKRHKKATTTGVEFTPNQVSLGSYVEEILTATPFSH
jgi:hypothetical protein